MRIMGVKLEKLYKNIKEDVFDNNLPKNPCQNMPQKKLWNIGMESVVKNLRQKYWILWMSVPFLHSKIAQKIPLLGYPLPTRDPLPSEPLSYFKLACFGPFFIKY